MRGEGGEGEERERRGRGEGEERGRRGGGEGEERGRRGGGEGEERGRRGGGEDILLLMRLLANDIDDVHTAQQHSARIMHWKGLRCES